MTYPPITTRVSDPHQPPGGTSRQPLGHLDGYATPDGLDPRVVAFGTAAPEPEPSTLRVVGRWLLPGVTAVIGLLLGIVVTSEASRPTAPVSITSPGETVTSTMTVTQSVTKPPVVVTKTRRVLVPTTKVTTAPAVTQTETETETETETVRQARPRGRLLPGRQ